MEPVKFQTSTQDASNGKAVPASNAPRDGFSILLVTVSLSVINAPHGRAVETASPAMEDTSYQRVLALLTQLPSMAPVMSSALSGKVLHALDVPRELSSIKMDSVSPSTLNAKLGILLMETAFLAMLDISYPLMADAHNHPSKPHQMLDALAGALISRHALNAPTDSSSILMENVNRSLIFALPGTKRMDFAQVAILDTISLVMDHAVFHSPIMIPKTLDVLPGTGISKSAYSAPTTGYLTRTMFASPFLINAPPLTTLVPAFLAIKDTTSTMESAASLQSNKSLMLDAPHGTGISKSVFNAQITGFSILKELVFQFLTYVLHTMLQELVFHVSLDMI